MEVQEAIERVLDGEGVLFLGTGFSLGAVNLRNEKFMTGPATADYFADVSGMPPGTGLEDAAEAFVDKSGIDALIREVQEQFTAKKICDYHKGVAALPWKRVYTTNYDNVFEFASRLESQRVTSVTMSANIYEIPKDHRICVHLNGYVENLDREKMGNELKLTDTSYVTASIADTPWTMLLRQDLRLASAVFFIGYSLNYDLDIKRILVETDDAKGKFFFCIGPTADQATHRRASRYGSVLDVSTEDFVSMTHDVAKSYIPRDRSELRTLSVREYKAPFAPSRITDQRFIDLLLWGRRSEELVAESLRTGTSYYLERPEVEEALRLIESGVRVLIVCSDLGNGKSMFLEGLRIRALERGFRVFDAFDHIDGVEQELEAIARLGDKVLVTIEEYQNWLDEIRLFRTNAGDQAVLVLTARNAVHDVLFDELSVMVGNELISELNIDILSHTDIEWVVDALDRYGLWGQQARLGRSQKVNYVVDRCQRQLHALLLKLLSSPDIGARLSLVADRIRSKGANYEPLLSIFILTLLNHPPTLDVLIDIWGPDRIGTPQFRTDPVMKEFVSFNYYAVLVRSPIAAEYVLRFFSDSGTVVPVLTRIAERIEKGAKFSQRYEDLFKSLMRFSSVQFLLPEQGRRNAVIRYYESLKNLDSCRRYPLFWLQYAIASLVIEDLPRAKTYFDTAYSLAAKRRWDTFQIDNHFARYLMVQAVRDKDVSSALANYRQARTIIDRQMRDERRHYPYRVAIYYQDFVNRFGASMDSTEIEEFASTATRVLQRIGELPEHRRHHRYVRDCQNAMKYVIDVCIELKTKEETRAQQKDSGDKK